MELRGKRALVTGSATRVGRVIALKLAEGGADIAVHYNSSSKEAEETAEEIHALGVKAVTVQGDVSQAQQVDAIVGRVNMALGSIDILVNSAAI